MEQVQHLDWIAGEWVAPLEGRSFARRRAASTDHWPRSTQSDVERALVACASAAPSWAAISLAERLRRLARLPDALEAEVGQSEDLAAAVGLDAAELAPRLEEERYRLREALELLAPWPEAGGAGVFQAHWSDFAFPLAARLAAPLAGGRAAVVLSDPRLPRAAECVARALECCDLPRGLVALVHGDAIEDLARALAHESLTWLRSKGLESELARWSRHLAPTVARALWPVRNASLVVESRADPAVAAALAVERAFGRSATLSAQLPGQVARVLCHQRLFSRFSEELLARLVEHPDARRPVPPLDADLPEHVRGAFGLGLDEGATGLLESRPRIGRREAEPSSDPDGAVRHPAGVGPHLLTNVDPKGRLARLARPAPVLALIRAASDEDARGLQLELDSQPMK